jgi:hypothetical protein
MPHQVVSNNSKLLAGSLLGITVSASCQRVRTSIDQSLTGASVERVELADAACCERVAVFITCIKHKGSGFSARRRLVYVYVFCIATLLAS